MGAGEREEKRGGADSKEPKNGSREVRELPGRFLMHVHAAAARHGTRRDPSASSRVKTLTLLPEIYGLRKALPNGRDLFRLYRTIGTRRRRSGGEIISAALFFFSCSGQRWCCCRSRFVRLAKNNTLTRVRPLVHIGLVTAFM